MAMERNSKPKPLGMALPELSATEFWKALTPRGSRDSWSWRLKTSICRWSRASPIGSLGELRMTIAKFLQ